MDQGTLVDERIDDARRFVERFAADGNSVQAAFWIKTAEEGIWFLYVATEIFDRDGPAAAYCAVHSSLQKLGESSISSSEIKVIGVNNPVTKDVVEIMARRSGQFALSDTTLGSIAAEQIIIYPTRSFTFNQANPMTPDEIGQEILLRMNRGPGVLQPLRVTLKDGTFFSGVPFSLELGTQRAMVARFIADREPAPRVIRLDEIASIN